MKATIRFILSAVTASLALGAAATAVSTASPMTTTPFMNMGMSDSPQASSLRARFNFLSHQTSNRCTLQPAAVMQMPAPARLRGSCCAQMAYTDYVRQIRGLKAYRGVSEIPPDPYNVSVGLAQQLFTFDKTYTLTSLQQATYDEAMKKATEHGPCCCKCWRYVAFRGQAKELIARRRYSASEIAQVWDLEDGCGSGNMMMMK